MPASHDGSRFSFNLAFTADVGISTQHMRDWAFKMRNGSITRAQRVDGRNDYWKITVNPGGLEHSGVDDVTITVKGKRNCTAVGAICTKEKHPAQLTNSPSATVVYSADATPSVSIAGGSGTEGTDSSIGFTVTLDEAATETVTVDYATSDGTADAGDDYTSTSGTLTFDAGTTSKTILGLDRRRQRGRERRDVHRHALEAPRAPTWARRRPPARSGTERSSLRPRRPSASPAGAARRATTTTSTSP